MSRHPEIIVEPFAEYEPGVDGYVVAVVYDYHDGKPLYGLPDWEERGRPDLAPVFSTESAALVAIARG